MKYKLIIFDLDGTLVDSRASITAAMQDMACELGLPQEQQGRRINIGLPMSDILRDFGIEDIEAARAAYRRHYHKYTHMELAFPGVPELLEQLRSNVPLSIATNKAYEGSLRTLGNAGIRASSPPLTRAYPSPTPMHLSASAPTTAVREKSFCPTIASWWATAPSTLNLPGAAASTALLPSGAFMTGPVF